MYITNVQGILHVYIFYVITYELPIAFFFLCFKGPHGMRSILRKG